MRKSVNDYFCLNVLLLFFFLLFNVLGNDTTNSSEGGPVCGHLSLRSRNDSEEQEGHENVC